MKKIKTYLPFFVLLLLPLLFYPVVDTSSWRSSSDVHAFFEFASSLLAITAGLMILLHFFTTGRWFFLIISIGFILIGTEEFVHAIFSFNRLWPETPPTFKLAISSTWLTGRFILVASFFIALIFREREIIPAKRGLYAVVCNLIGLIVAAFVIFLIFESPHIPDFVQLGSITKKLLELSLAFLFFVAFVFYANIYLKQPSRSPLLLSIIVCIIFQVLGQIFVFDSQAFYDSHWDVAHLIVFLSYFSPIFGVWGETIKLHNSSQVRVIELRKEMIERKQAEEALQESEEHLRLFLEHSADVIYTIDLDYKIHDISPSVEHLLGYKPAELNGLSVAEIDILAPESLDQAYRDISSVFSGNTIFASEYVFLNKDGSRRVAETSGSPFIKNRTVVGLISIARDITARKHAEEALQESEERFRELADATWEGIIIHRDGIILDVNESILKMSGWHAEEVIGKSALEFLAPESIETALQKLGESIDTPSIIFEGKGLRKDKTVFPIEMLGRPIRYKNLDARVIAIRDITERIRTEEQLRASLREKEILLNEIHHRVKNNLQVISGLLSLQARASKNQELTKMLNESQIRIRSMAMIYEKLYAAKDFEKIGLAGYVRSLAQELFQSYKINSGEISLIVQTNGEVYVDINKAIPCGLIMNELISNALKHAFPDDRTGEIKIIISETKETEIEIIVRDNGLGLPNDIDIHQPRTVGLHLVNGLVTSQLDGQIEVRRGAGTEFRITIPCDLSEGRSL